MKFICPSCKAKYQIADEKVADHAVRMKCRKCARVIRITQRGAELAESAAPSKPQASAVTPAPRPTGGALSRPSRPSATSLAPRPPLVGSGLSAPRPSSAMKPPPRPSGVSPKPAAASGGAAQTPLRSAAQGPEPAQNASGPRAAGAAGKATGAVAAKAVPAARNAAAAAVAQGNALAKKGIALAKDATPAKARGAPAAPKALTPNKGAAVAPRTSVEAHAQSPEVAPPSSDSALAGAFTAAVQAPGTDLDTVGDEWFVGINGVPVGPIKLAELRSKAASGAVTRESLVWRDGFEEWKPLGTFPELVAVVEEGTSSTRASMEPLSPDATIASAMVPRALIEPVPTVVSAPAEDQAELEQLAGLRRKGGLSVPQIFAMVVAILFGLTVGFVVFSGTEKTKEVIKYVKVPSETEARDQAPAPEEPNALDTDKAEQAAAEPAKATRNVKPGKTTATESEQKTGLKGLSGLSGLAAGPSNGPSGSQASNASSGKPLDSAAVQSTVRRYTPSVKRSCWQPALDTRDANAPTSARVGVTITVSGSGSVQNVSTTGDPRGYRGLATCIARRVQGWQFPASSGQTTVNVPFVFAAQ
jgi:predicted Zn finger-like uncharacterized protein